MYVGTQALEGVQDINEQQVGVAVFGRQPGYETPRDNIVRVNAMELRKRIESYFANEGKEESLVFEVPRGTYALLFKKREVALAEHPLLGESAVLEDRDASPSGASPKESVERPRDLPIASSAWSFNSLAALLTVIMVASAVWAAVETFQNRRSESALHVWRSSAALNAFWLNFFGKGQPVEIVIADPAFTLAQEMTHQPLSLADYLDYRYRNIQSAVELSPEASKQQRSDLALIFSHNDGSVGDFRVARRIAEMEVGGGPTRLVYARDYSSHALRRNNAVLVGSSRSNPWAQLFEGQMAYHLVPANGTSEAYVQVDHPVGNEPARYTWTSDQNAEIGYCIIGLLPNLTNTGSTLTIAGTTSLATEAGGDFVTSEESLSSLLARFHRTTFPNFQLLLRVTRSNGTPIGTEILSYRLAAK
jgi:hypothetical protein